jgi:arylsulfatase A-like enzyme
VGPQGLALRIPIERADWKQVGDTSVWRTPVVLSLPRYRRGVSLGLVTPEGRIPRADLASVRAGGTFDGFALFQDSVVISGTPPEHAVLHCRIPQRSAERAGRVDGPDFSGAGFALRSGTRAVCDVRVPAPHASALSFATLLEPVLTPPEEELRVSVRVRADGELVLDHEETFRAPGLPAWHRVPLPAGCARLEIEVEGMLATVAVLDPRIGPLEIGTRGARPWGAAPPDVVVFLADTFRADNLAAYGGTAGVTPNLDALAAASLCFTQAWSSATWTLPAHATLFSGYLPFQAGTTSEAPQLPDALVTLPEMLAHAGYRTVALTDGAYVSGEFGLDQGFGVFSERTRDLAEKLAETRRCIAADDGRPLFLFVQTYRVHWPYRFDAETVRVHGERLGIRGTAGELAEAALAEARSQGDEDARFLADLTQLQHTPRMRAIADELRAHYLGGVAELDGHFGRFLELLRTSGVLADGYLVFTSDHGEAFLEHGGLFHSQLPYEEQARIPLLVHGAALQPREIDHAVSLLDVAPTVAALAGIPPQPAWLGRSLLASVSDRPVLSFRVAAADDDGFALIDGRRKVLMHRATEPARAPDGRILGAFDLTLDAAETDDAAAAGAAWPREVLARHADRLELALDPIVQGEAAELDPERAAELKALGY